MTGTARPSSQHRDGGIEDGQEQLAAGERDDEAGDLQAQAR